MDEVDLRELFEGNPTAACIVGSDGWIRACNPAFKKMFSLPDVQHGCAGRFDALLADPTEWERAVGELVAGRSPNLFEADGQAIDGRTLHLEGSLRARPVPAGGVMAWLREVTGAQELARGLRDQDRHIGMISRLVRGVAHDINNMLMVIVGYSEALVKGLPVEGRSRRILGEIRKATNRAAALTQLLLEVARRPDLRVEELSLAAVVEESADLVRRLVGEEVTLEIRAEHGTGRIRADRNHVMQVLLNLVDHARDSMNKGGRLILEVANVNFEIDSPGRPSVSPGAYAVLRVSDTGMGMDREALERVRSGTGLAAISDLCKRCGGLLWCESEPGRGSVFSVYLSAVTAEPTAP